jgi:hypothetical protein
MNEVSESSDYKGFCAYLRGCRAPDTAVGDFVRSSPSVRATGLRPSVRPCVGCSSPMAGSIEGRLN